MKLDKFLAALFSKKVVAVILLVAVALFCLTACSLTFEDVLCLAFCGCVSFDTCREMIWACNCGDCSPASGDAGEPVGCNGSCIGDPYNACFGCVWDGGLKDCRPSTICAACDKEEQEDDYDYSSTSCEG